MPEIERWSWVLSLEEEVTVSRERGETKDAGPKAEAARATLNPTAPTHSQHSRTRTSIEGGKKTHGDGRLLKGLMCEERSTTKRGEHGQTTSKVVKSRERRAMRRVSGKAKTS